MNTIATVEAISAPPEIKFMKIIRFDVIVVVL